MTTITLTPEQIQVLDQAGDRSIRIEDPRNRRTYLLVEEPQTAPGPVGRSLDDDIPEGILRSQDAFLRDLPELLKDESLRGLWVVYHGDERIGIAPKKQPLLDECARRGLKREDYGVFVIEETEEVDYPSAWMR